MKKKQLILSLIRDNLVNTRLLIGLENLGFETGQYNLNLNDTITKLIGIEISDKNYEAYLKLYTKVKHMDISERPEQLNQLSKAIYKAITSKKFR